MREALSLTRGARVRHGCDVLDLADQETGERLPFIGGAVGWTWRPPDPLTGGQTDGVAEVRRTAGLTLAGPLEVDLQQRRLRIWTEFQLRTGDWARFHMGVFTTPRPALRDDGTLVGREISLADKSYAWREALLDEPEFVPPTTVVTTYVKAELTRLFGETSFSITPSTAVLGGRGMVFEGGTSRLELWSTVLKAIAFDQLTADEQGRPLARPLSDISNRAPEITYGPGQAKIKTQGEVAPILPTLPNVLRFASRQGPSSGSSVGNGLHIVRNQSTGPASIDARGGSPRGEVVQRVDVDASTQEQLVAIATAEAPRYFAGGGLTFTGQVGLNPRHSDRDVIGLDLPRLGLSGSWFVTSWTYPLQPIDSESGAVMEITAEQKIA